ncbi:protein of unknown function [Pseudomonas mediterranea]
MIKEINLSPFLAFLGNDSSDKRREGVI